MDDKLRDRAEEFAREEVSSDDLAMSPHELGKALHELRVHQIELEMQNDELRQKQIELDASRARYFDLYDLAPVGYITISEQGLILEANLTVATMLGATRGDITRQSISRFIFMEDQDIWYTHRKKLFKTEEIQTFDVRMIKVGGIVFWVNMKATTAQAENGVLVCHVVINDLSERKEVEETLAFLATCGSNQEGLDFFRDLSKYLAESLKMDFVCIDRLEGDGLNARTVAIYFDGHFEDNITYALKDTPCGDVVGKTVCCFPRDVRGLFPRDLALQDMMAESYVGITLWDSNGYSKGLIAVIGRHSLVDTRRAECILQLCGVRASAELERLLTMESLRLAKDVAEISNRSKSEFLANMSHEIRTPLNGILGMLQLLQMTEPTDEQKDYLVNAIKSTNRLTRLLADILDISRMEAGKMAIIEEEFSIECIKEAILELFTPPAKEKLLGLTFKIDPMMPKKLIGDEARVRQILFNLVGNSLKFTANGSVHVQAQMLSTNEKLHCKVLFTVSDTGIGISDQQLKTVFDPFVQGEGSYTRRYQGAGLGLSIVRKLVKIMNGELAIDNTPGEGTAVYLTLPFKISRNEKIEPDQTLHNIENISDALPCILLAEDDEINLITGRRILEKSGYTVFTAVNGLEAVDMLAKHDFDIILMDIQMPLLDGVEATKIIRESTTLGHKSKIPIIAMTSYAMTGDKEKFLASGMDGYLSKPVDIIDLKNTIAEILKKTVTTNN